MDAISIPSLWLVKYTFTFSSIKQNKKVENLGF